jgi:hypothetical protein
MSHLTLEVN